MGSWKKEILLDRRNKVAGIEKGMEENKKHRDEKRKEYRYYISSLATDIDTFQRVVRGQQRNCHLDMNFREYANTTLDRDRQRRTRILSGNGVGAY